MARKSRRTQIIKALDEITFRLDTTRYLVDAPKTPYQPLPWIGINDSRRAVGTRRRWEAMRQAIAESKVDVANAIDVGCNVGFFSLSLMNEGWFVYGVEGLEKNLRIAVHAAGKASDGGGTFVPIHMMVDEENVKFLPQAQVTICLSIWHHWVRHMGAESAKEILASLWKNTGTSMFFDTGQEEMPDYYNLPFKGPAKAWLAGYLAEVCEGGEVSAIGEFPAFTSGGHESGEGRSERTLFHIKRK